MAKDILFSIFFPKKVFFLTKFVISVKKGALKIKISEKNLVKKKA